MERSECNVEDIGAIEIGYIESGHRVKRCGYAMILI